MLNSGIIILANLLKTNNKLEECFMTLQITAIIIFLFTVVQAVVTAIKQPGLEQRIKSSSVGVSLAALAVVCQFADMILFDCSRWDAIMMVVYVMYMVIRVLTLSSLVEDMVRGERVD